MRSMTKHVREAILRLVCWEVFPHVQKRFVIWSNQNCSPFLPRRIKNINWRCLAFFLFFLLGLVRDWGIFFFVFSPGCVPIKFSKFPTFPPLCSPPQDAPSRQAPTTFSSHMLWWKLNFGVNFRHWKLIFNLKNIFFSHKLSSIVKGPVHTWAKQTAQKTKNSRLEVGELVVKGSGSRRRPDASHGNYPQVEFLIRVWWP